MKNTIKLLLCMLTVVGFMYGLAHADSINFKTPRGSDGSQAFPQYAGAKYTVLSTTELLVSSQPLVIYGVLMSTGAFDTFVVIRDTDVTNGNGTQVVPRIMYQNNSSTSAYSDPGRFNYPIRLNKGATGQIGGVAGKGEQATILYMDNE